MFCLQSRWCLEGKRLVYYGLRCVNRCPEQALEVSYSLPLRLYLRKKKKNKTILYL